MKPFARINLASAAMRRGNVANVEVLPIPIPIANERKTEMKKLMMAAGCTRAFFAWAEMC